MSYTFIDREIIVGEISNCANLSDGALCGLVMYKKAYYLEWIQGVNDIWDIEIREITRAKCFIQRTGLGIIRLENNKYYLYATTGKLLFKDKYADYRISLSKAKIAVKRFNFTPHINTPRYQISAIICHISSNDDIGVFIKSLSFNEVHSHLSDNEFVPFKNVYTNGLGKMILEFYETGFVSLWFNYFSKHYKNVYDVPIRERVLYYFDSEWSLWDSQHTSYNDG